MYNYYYLGGGSWIAAGRAGTAVNDKVNGTFARVLACLSSLAGVDCRIRLHQSCQANYGQHWHAQVWTINVFMWPEAGVVTMKLCTKARVNTDA